MRNFMLIISVCGVLFSCATRDTERNYGITAEAEEEIIVASSLVINEFAPKSKLLNEFGEEADWIELFNNSDEVLEINSAWSLTDDENNLLKYVLPDTILQPGAHLLIWCDEQFSDTAIWHAGFKLNGNGETIYLCKNEVIVDEVSYDDDIKKSCSYGRSADGTQDWEKFKEPTPGNSNQLLEHYAESL